MLIVVALWAAAPVLAQEVQSERAADRFWGADAMATAERKLRREHGGIAYGRVLFNLAEVQMREGRDGYEWDGEASYGGDIHRALIRTEGEGDFGNRVESAEVQALYSRALDPYWNLQTGIRQDIGQRPRRTYASLGVEGLAPYWFDVEATMFLSSKGELLGRVQADYDQRITQNLVLQPRIEINFAAQDISEQGIGAGATELDLGVRLRYEKVRELAPYGGFVWKRNLGETARSARRTGDDTDGFSLVLGVRTWF